MQLKKLRRSTVSSLEFHVYCKETTFQNSRKLLDKCGVFKKTGLAEPHPKSCKFYNEYKN
jgi:hypothetical protein